MDHLWLMPPFAQSYTTIHDQDWTISSRTAPLIFLHLKPEPSHTLKNRWTMPSREWQTSHFRLPFMSLSLITHLTHTIYQKIASMDWYNSLKSTKHKHIHLLAPSHLGSPHSNWIISCIHWKKAQMIWSLKPMKKFYLGAFLSCFCV